MIRDYIGYAFGNLVHRKLRSWLTIIGIMIGIAAVVALVSLGQGLTVTINEQFAKLGGDKILIQARGFSSPGSKTAINLSDSDLDYLKKIPGIADASGLLFSSAKIEHDNEARYVYISGIPTDKERFLVEETFGLELDKGRLIRKGDKLSVILGYNYQVSKKVFPKPLAVGDKVLINGIKVDVIGFYKAVGNPDDDQNIYISNEGFEELYGKTNNYFMLMARVAKDKNPTVMATVVQEKLRRNRGEEKGKETFFVQTFEQLIQQFTIILTVMQAILLMIALVSLLVGAIGILNTMYTAVLERTSEIGVMKAVGARNGDIFTVFLIESGFIGLVGGILGVGLGYLISVGLSGAAASVGYSIIKPYFPWWLIAGTLAFAFICGAASGSWPAWNASKLNPVDALRWE